MNIIFTLGLLLTFCARANAECANACNGHGKCTSYDMCICNRNWQANDCSERVCMFGLAHVDTPKGDLDMSGIVDSPYTTVAENSPVYPYGTSEIFPLMEDSDHRVLDDSAHYYMECSNKGKCTRTTGECACYDGYEGVACQRASCPGSPTPCSGKGVCKTIKQLAMSDNQNVYELWDKHSTLGCECDPGYYGPDCSLRMCKYGIDPLYLDDSTTVKYSSYDVGVFTTAKVVTDFTDGTPTGSPGKGLWAIRVYDNFGEDWLTAPILAGASCDDVVSALEAIPNKVIPAGTIVCTRTMNENARETVDFSFNYERGINKTADHGYFMQYNMAIWEAETAVLMGEINNPAIYIPTYVNSFDQGSLDAGTPTPAPTTTITDTVPSLSGYIYRLHMYGNPGGFKQPEVELYLDGKRPSLASASGAKIITKVWTDGQQGEYKDFFGDHCDGVTVTVERTGDIYYLSSFTVAEKALLKACLGDSDFSTDNNAEVYNWDFGTKFYPHLVKLVRTVSTYMDGGYYAALWYDTTICSSTATTQCDNLLQTNTEGSTTYGTIGTFRLLNPFISPDRHYLGETLENDRWEIYTTKGTFALTSNWSEATFSFGSKYIYTTNTSYDINVFKNPFDGDISCQATSSNTAKFAYINHCLNVSDMFTVLSWDNPTYNPPRINLYKAKRYHTNPSVHNVLDIDAGEMSIANANSIFAANYPNSLGNVPDAHYLTHFITTDIATNWGASVNLHPAFHVYKFFPAAESTYEYVAECSNRGICDTSSGVCNCFSGYTSDSCSEQSSLHL